MRWVRCGSVLAAAALATGCLSSSTVIKVKADGSGTIEQQMLVSASALNMLTSLGGDAQETGDLFGEEAMQKHADRMGKGVRLVSSEPIDVNGMKGARAIYAFDDINAIRVSDSPELPGVEAGEEAKGNPMSITLERRGTDRVLTIAMPEPKEGEAAEPAETPEQPDRPQEIPPEAMGMMKMLLGGMRINIAVEVDGEITRTNAEYREGSRVTLADVDFDELVKDEESFKSLQTRLRPGASPAELQKALQNVKGVKVNSERVITIEWR